MNKTRIFIVEDETLVSMDIEDRLMAMGYDLAGTATSGEKALQCVRDLRPDLVLMDISLKGDMDGITTAEMIRRESRLPVIFLTAYSDDATMERAKLVEPAGYIFKPFNGHELKSAIEIALYRHTASLSRSGDGEPKYFFNATENITEQVRQREQITLLNRLYNVLSQVSQAVVRVASTKTFLEESCRVIVEEGDLMLSWIGYVEKETHRVIPTEWSGRAVDYVRGITVYADDRPEGRGPTGRSIRERRSVVYNDFLHSELTEPWRERAVGFGIKSAAAFPIVSEGNIWGALTVYSDEVDFFSEPETKLLEKVAVEIGFALDIMEKRRQVEKAVADLKESEDQYRSLFENMAQGGVYQLADGTLIGANNAALKIFGLSREEFMERSPFDSSWDLIREDGSPFPSEKYPSIMALNTGLPVKDVVAGILNHQTKERVWVSINAIPQFRNREERPYRVFVTLHDITSHKKAESEKGETVNFLGLLNACKSKEEMIRSAIAFFQHQSGCLSVGIRLREGNDYPYYETRGFSKEFVQEENQLCTRDPDGEVIRDTSGNPILSCMCGNVISGRFDPTKPYFTSGGSFWTNSATELMASAAADLQSQLRNRCNKEGYESRALLVLRSTDETFGLLQLNDTRKGCFTLDTLTRWEGFTGYLAVALSKFKAEEATEAFKRQNELILNSAGEGILGVDVEGKHSFANPSAARMLGYEVHELIGKSSHQLYHHTRESGEAYPEEECPIYHSYRNGMYCPVTEEVFWRKDGTICPVRYSTAPIIENGRIQGAVVTFRDISERRQIEKEKKELRAQLVQAQKMEALGTLAGGIAHDFNNILSAIIGYTELALGDIPAGTELMNDLQDVLQAAFRAMDLASHILTFSRQGQVQKLRPISIGLIIKETLKLLRASLPSTIEIHSKISDQAGAVMGDSTQMYQILMNLCTNSAHAMRRNGGMLEIELTSLEFDAEVANCCDELKVGEYIKLIVKDTGHGMESATLERIFDPYFTTKEVGEGTGLGLAIVHGIVKRHQGVIKAFSHPGEGTTFELIFPKIKTIQEKPTPFENEIHRGTERILFVDDENALAGLGGKMLSQLGYQVTAKTDSLEALEIFRSQPNDFDLVITDQTMPRMTGANLAMKIKLIRRNIPIILCTGFSETINEENAKAMGIYAFILKPIERRIIAEVIRKALDDK